jgi:MinD superfamily P-loop ATPase
MYIAIASGKGGTGKTLVSTTLALILAASRECTYVDLDVEEPNGWIFLNPDIEREESYSLPVPRIDEAVCTFCRACAESCVYNALTVIPAIKKAIFFPELCHYCGVCAYVCPVKGALEEVDREIGKIRTGRAGPLRFIEGRLNVGQPSGVPLISGIIHHYISLEDMLIVDSSPGTSCPVVESLKGSDCVVLVTEPTPFGLNDLKLTVELVEDLGKKAFIIVNKVDADTIGKAQRTGTIIDDFAHEAGIPVVLKIPYSIDIQKAYSQGIPLVRAMPELEGPFKDVLQQIMDSGTKK